MFRKRALYFGILRISLTITLITCDSYPRRSNANSLVDELSLGCLLIPRRAEDELRRSRGGHETVKRGINPQRRQVEIRGVSQAAPRKQRKCARPAAGCK
ncbi:hypothetical protein DFH08DRAFT_834356 [Mycena albidolilacea]|uniref:Secreted protein n=1 Tax=Mycena albidolilacea TaxID=1033008 RepID=A0AAD7ARY8_9AGAR|nr:hypothetical protein DFH08DRAFT_834356 [Mycena albidolilacea]